MKQIIEYKLVSGSSLVALEASVNEMIQNGYQPYGIPFTIAGQRFNYVAQAMVKTTDV